MTLRTELPPPSPDITSVISTPAVLKKPRSMATPNGAPEGSALYWVTTMSAASTGRAVRQRMASAMAPRLIMSPPSIFCDYRLRRNELSKSRVWTTVSGGAAAVRRAPPVRHNSDKQKSPDRVNWNVKIVAADFARLGEVAMRVHRRTISGLCAALVLAGCVSRPAGPTLAVMPGPKKSFEALQTHDVVCRNFAAQTLRSGENSANHPQLGTAALRPLLGGR